MLKTAMRKRVYLVLAVIFLVSLACRVEPPRLVLDNSPTPPPTVVITRVATEIITATPLPVVPTSAPSNTPVVPTPSPTYDPLTAPIYYPIPDCVASRLHVGDKAMVSLVGGPNGIRYGLDIHNDTVATYAQPGDILLIVNGPWCSQGWLVWLVETQDGFRGYTPEGDGNTYWLFPVK